MTSRSDWLQQLANASDRDHTGLSHDEAENFLKALDTDRTQTLSHLEVRTFLSGQLSKVTAAAVAAEAAAVQMASQPGNDIYSLMTSDNQAGLYQAQAADFRRQARQLQQALDSLGHRSEFNAGADWDVCTLAERLATLRPENQ